MKSRHIRHCLSGWLQGVGATGSADLPEILSGHHPTRPSERLSLISNVGGRPSSPTLSEDMITARPGASAVNQVGAGRVPSLR